MNKRGEYLLDICTLCRTALAVFTHVCWIINWFWNFHFNKQNILKYSIFPSQIIFLRKKIQNFQIFWKYNQCRTCQGNRVIKTANKSILRNFGEYVKTNQPTMASSTFLKIIWLMSNTTLYIYGSTHWRFHIDK
jgi:hypothetical protein